MTTWMRRRAPADDGMTLVEVMVAILLLGVVLSAMASTLITGLQAIVGTELQTRANQLGNELIEELQALPWDTVGLYESEVVAAAHLGATLEFEGEPVEVLPDATPRDPRVPLAEETLERDGSEYEVARAITWSNDGSGDYKRFVVELTWMESNRERTLRVAGTRAPAPLDEVRTLTAELAVDQTTVAYNSDGTAATPTELNFTATFDPEADFLPQLTWDDDGVPTEVGTFTSVDGGLTWTATVQTLPDPWPSGDVTFTVNGTHGDLEAEASTTVHVTYEGEPPTVEVRPPLTLSQPYQQGQTTQYKDPICVKQGGKPDPNLLVDIDVLGLASADDGLVGVSWTGQATPLVAAHLEDNEGGAVFRLAVNNEYTFPTATPIVFSVHRRADTNSEWDTPFYTDTFSYETKSGGSEC